MSARLRGALAASLFALAACTTVANEAAPDPAAALDEPVFRCRVQPVLVRQCSYLACHGNAGSALRVYSPGKLRAVAPTSIDELGAALSDAEQHANFLSAAGFAFNTAPDDNFLLRKPLASAAGGYEHLGGAIFGRGSTDYDNVHAWLAGEAACP
jgi:hypothetical protein